MIQHPLSAIFPPLPDDELEALAADIKKHGLRQPIIMFEGQVLDGWHRYLACKIAGVRAVERSYDGTNPVAFVKSANWHRRHLSESQRAQAIVSMNEWRSPGRSASNPVPGTGLKSTAELAKEAGTSPSTIERAKVVEERGSKVLKKAVVAGEVSGKRAAKIARLPKAEQPKALKAEPPKSLPKPTVPLEQYQALEEKYEELVAELETCEAIRGGDVAKEMNLLRASLKQANRTRDDAMRTQKEMRGQIDYLNRELKKLGWKKAV